MQGFSEIGVQCDIPCTPDKILQEHKGGELKSGFSTHVEYFFSPIGLDSDVERYKISSND